MKMNISPLSFKGAVLNINSFSDNHGNLDKLDSFYQSFEQNKDELFLPNEKGNQNALVIAGDWFIAGNTKGYKTNKYENSHYFQTFFFNKFIEGLEDFSNNMKTYFIVGNHELDAGVSELKKVLSSICATVLMTNLDFKASPALKPLIDENKIVKKDILEIEDDKNPNLKHKALFLGISPVNMPYYRRNLGGIGFLNEVFKAAKLTQPEDYKETFDAVIAAIEEFKKENPNGLVIVSSHTGVDFAQNLAQKLGKDKVNLILNAHEHGDGTEEVSGVKIVNLNQNFKKYVNAKFFIDDDGTLKSDVQLTSYYPTRKKAEISDDNYFDGLYRLVFREDLKIEYQIVPDDSQVKVLSVDDVRVGNNYLANFVVDSILSEIQKTNPEVQIFGINASAIRTSLDTVYGGGANNLQAMNVLNGIVYEEAYVFKNEVTGLMLLDLVLENLLFNETAPERNPIMHYCGLVIEKSALLEGYHKGKSAEYLSSFVKTTDGKPLDLKEIYTVANVEKYFKKSKKPLIHEILYSEAVPLHLNARELFIAYLNENKDGLKVKCDNRIIG